jgi:mRNA-degrading endonuclease toxin of MazEF toxin-antitoxin module
VVTRKPGASPARSAWIPDRQDIIWIDCNPQVGREMRDVHPFLVLSPAVFNDRTSLVIGLPMTTAAYNADNPFAVAAGAAKGRKGRADQLRAVPSAEVLRLAPARRPTAPAWTPVRQRARPGLRMPEPDRPPGVMSRRVVVAVRKEYRLRLCRRHDFLR